MEQKSLLIRGGTVVSDSSAAQMDLSVQSGRIIAQGSPGSFDKEHFSEVIDASGLFVLPGLIDPHVHFDSPFMGSKTVHDFHSGSIAAAYGGITTVISFTTQGKSESIIKNIESQNRIAEEQSLIDWGFHGIVLDAKEDTLSEIQQLINAGYPTYKCFTTYRHSNRMVEDTDILALLEVTARNNAMLMVHCESDVILEHNLKKVLLEKNEWINHAKSRPASAENVEIARIIDLMREEVAPVYIVHTSTREGMGLIQDAINTGLPLHCETCTHYLVLTEDQLKGENGYQFICSPPLRKKEDNEALWLAAINGPIEVISSDDAGVPTADRIKFGEGRFDKIPNGMPGIEPRLAVLYSQGVVKGRNQSAKTGRAYFDQSRQAVWSVSSKRSFRGWRRCRYGDLRPEPKLDHIRVNASYEYRFFTVRRDECSGKYPQCPLSRRVYYSRRCIGWDTRDRQINQEED